MSSCRIALAAIVFLGGDALNAADPNRAVDLFDFQTRLTPAAIETRDANALVTAVGAVKVLRMETGTKAPWPGITLKAPHGKWDLSRRTYLAVGATNVGDSAATLSCRVDNPGADGRNHCVTRSITLNPHARGTILILFKPNPYGRAQPTFIGMRAGPFGPPDFDPANVTQLLLFVSRSRIRHAFAIDRIRVGGARGDTNLPADPKDFLPMIDRFGQYGYRDWPGKTHSVRQLQVRGVQEAKQLATATAAPGWDRYGGWATGPQRQATGHFRVEKYRGKWWLVDPAGRLFWSHGVDCVGSQNPTPISDRENYFRDLPASGSELARFYGQATWAPHGYYRDHAPYRTYDFLRANLLRKQGEDFARIFAQQAHRRLRHWGLNTIGNWSDSTIYRLDRTPYVVAINYRAKLLAGSKGYWGKFPDVFDPSFRAGIRRRMAGEKGRSAGDPWCIGYFVDNELSWGDEVSLAVAALASPADQAAKRTLVADLHTKYQTIDRLNAAWGCHHRSWDALLASTDVPDRKRARSDLTAFYTRTAETYFKTIRDVLKQAAPGQLYLGCRFSSVNDRAARAAARYCDVVGYNRYTYGVEDLALPDRIDRPLIIGEFHFGALDRGMFHTGLRPARDQNHRAQCYRDYVRGALRNPNLVGTHWFQFKDQPTTGRGDGENYQIGLIDICDRPYPETVRTCRDVGYSMYGYRFGTR